MFAMHLISKIKIPLLFSIRLLAMVVCLSCFIQLHSSHAGNLNDLDALIGKQDAVLVADPLGNVLFSKHADLQLIPASVLKLLSSLVALHHLGPDYRFTTDFYLDRQKNLIVKGYGDPLLISEVLANIAANLAHRLDNQQKKINDLVLDDSFFSEPLIIPGVTSSCEPYDAPNGALCVNFNTVNFKRNNNGTYVSAEPQTPLLPFMHHRIHASRLKQGRIVLSRKDNEITLYAGHLLLYFIKRQGIQLGGKIRIGRVQKASDKLIFRYVSEFSMVQIISKLLEHSNNFTANQLLIAAGAQTFGPPGTLKKGVLAASNFAVNVIGIADATIVEGSGISRKNRISATNILKILEAFEPYHYLMQKDGRLFYKTGTLSGIQTRAGYIENKNGGLYRFVVLINTAGKSAGPIMDILLKNLE